MPVGFLHRARRILCGDHNLFDQTGKYFEVAGSWRLFGGVWRIRGLGGWIDSIHRGFRFCARWTCAHRQFVKAHGGGLPQVHRRLARICWNFDEDVAPGEVFARQAVLFRSEDECDAFASPRDSVIRGASLSRRTTGCSALRWVRVPVPSTREQSRMASARDAVSRALLSNSGAPTAERASRQWG